MLIGLDMVVVERPLLLEDVGGGVVLHRLAYAKLDRGACVETTEGIKDKDK